LQSRVSTRSLPVSLLGGRALDSHDEAPRYRSFFAIDAFNVSTTGCECLCHTPRNRTTRYGSVIPSDAAIGSRPLPAALNAHVLSRWEDRTAANRLERVLV